MHVQRLNPAGRTIAALKAADETVNNSATLQDDDELIVTLAPNRKYQVRAMLFVSQANAAAGIKVQLVSDATIAGRVEVKVWDETLNTLTALDRATFGGGSAGPVAGGNSVGNNCVEIDGAVDVDSGGILKIQWAQNVATVANTQVQQHSYLLVTDMGPK